MNKSAIPPREAGKRGRLLIALFFAALFLAGLLASGGYGLPYDELSEQVILRENLKEYAYQLSGPQSEAVRYYDGLGVQRISESIERDHGQSAYYPFAPLLLLAPEPLTVLWHAYTWLWFMAGVLAIYGFGREMGFSRPEACFTALLLYLAPRFFAEGHYNNKDILLLSLALLTLFLGLRFLKKPAYLRGLLFSLAGAMAVNTKIVGLMPWGLVGLCALGLVTARGEWSLRMLRVALFTVFSFIAFFVLLTPALWPDPVGHFQHVTKNAAGFTRWTGVILYRGMRIDQQQAPIPRLYLPTMMAVTLPLYTLPLAIIGQARALGGMVRAALRRSAALLRQEQPWMLAALTLCWLLPLGYAAWLRPLVYNGWRHFYFVYTGIALLAGYGIAGLSAWLGRLRLPALSKGMRSWNGKALGAALLCLCFAVSAVGIAVNHPYQYGYYHPLARASAGADMEMDYWGLSTVNAMKELAASIQRDESLPLELGSREEMTALSLANGYRVLPEALRSRLSLGDSGSPYLLDNATYTKIYGLLPPEGYHVLFTLESYENALCTVYEAAR